MLAKRLSPALVRLRAPALALRVATRHLAADLAGYLHGLFCFFLNGEFKSVRATSTR
jgi:hypothetical protein